MQRAELSRSDNRRILPYSQLVRQSGKCTVETDAGLYMSDLWSFPISTLIKERKHISKTLAVNI